MEPETRQTADHTTVRALVFSTKRYDQQSIEEVNRRFGHELSFVESRLRPATAGLAAGFEAVIVFVNDEVNREAIEALAGHGVKLIATRSAGYNQVDLEAAAEAGIPVVRVPAYSPHSVAEFTVGLILTLGRKIHRAHNRVRENNFELDGLQGFELHGRTIGIIGTGRIGATVIKCLSGFGCRILAFDQARNPEVEELAEYLDDPREIARQSDIISLHVPLTPETRHLVNRETLQIAKDGFMLVNTSRGALCDTRALVDGLKSGKIGALAIDVYEEEGDLFFRDLSDEIVADDVFARLLTFPNVLVTGHQAFLTDRALENIAETTLRNLKDFEETGDCPNRVENG
jgi:D-lactate dehydrogenase